MSFVYPNNRNKSYIFKDCYFLVDNRLWHALFLFLPVKSDFYFLVASLPVPIGKGKEKQENSCKEGQREGQESKKSSGKAKTTKK